MKKETKKLLERMIKSASEIAGESIQIGEEYVCVVSRTGMRNLADDLMEILLNKE